MATATTTLEVVITGRDMFSSAARAVTAGVSNIEQGAGRMSTAFGKLEGALGHAKSQIGGLLSGPLGVLGLGAGILGVSELMGSALQKTSDFGLEIEKLTHLTGESAQSMGDLALVAEKFGIDFDRLAQIVGFTEKTMGRLENTSAHVAAGHLTVAKATEAVTKAHEKLSLATLKLTTDEGKKHVSAVTLATDQVHLADATRALAKAEQDLSDAQANKSVIGLNKLQALQKQYGVILTDNKGQALTFSAVLNNVADYYTSNATAANKAALSAQLFGRGYATLIPILALGSAGIQRSKQAIDDMGLSLGTNTQGALEAYKQALRSLGEAVDILQIQIGLALEPVLTDLANTVSLFLEHGGAKQIVAVFKSMAEQAKALGSFIGSTVIPALQTLGGAAAAAWNAIPGPMKQILSVAFLANKTTRFLFNFGLGDVVKGLAGIGGGLLARGGTPANPLFVADVTGGGGLGGAAEGAAGGAAGLGASLSLATIAASIAILAIPVVLIAASKDANVQSFAPPGKTFVPHVGFVPTPGGGTTSGGAAGTSGGLSPDDRAAQRAGLITADNTTRLAELQGQDNAYTASIASSSEKLLAEQRAAHQKAKEAVGGQGKDFHEFLLAFRSGNAQVAIKDFPKELAYLATASDATKRGATFTKGVQEDIAALKRAEVGATDSQKRTLAADIKALQRVAANAAARAHADSLAEQRRILQIAISNHVSAQEVARALNGIATYDKSTQTGHN